MPAALEAPPAPPALPVDGATPGADHPRVLVFVVAYESERHIVEVFERVPAELFEREDVAFLYIDDASTDYGPQRLEEWVRKHQIRNVLIARNSENQGYGGNQKIGYRYAVDRGYDLVILLHGDGQYAPELLPRFIDTYNETGADVILGSRMRQIASARSGGMPWHKVVGNRVLTRIQNTLTGLNLSEYHTGYRAYSADFLRSVPFGINTNDFHFDTQILLQAANVGAKVVEFDIPTHYGDEVCRVNGPRYAANVLASTAQFRLHRSGMMCSIRYRDTSNERYRDKSDLAASSHAMALRWVRELAPTSITDVGCGPGHVARLCEAAGARVTGIDREPPLERMMSRFVSFDLEDGPLPVDAFESEVVLLLDVIEHLADPEQFLIELRERSPRLLGRDPKPRLLLSTPNVAFVTMRLNLLLGRFTYADRGILDMTHKRLFTKRTLLRALRDCGYEVQRCRGVPPPFALAFGKKWWTGPVTAVASGLARVWPSMFAFQILVLCRPLASMRSLLRQLDPPSMSENKPDAHPEPARSS